MVWYTAMNTADAEAVRKLFKEKHPFLNLTVLRQPGEKIRTRILTEMRAGKFFWDVVSFNHLDMDALNQEGLLAPYVSPEIRSAYPQGAVEPDGRWAAIYVRQYVIGYNTGLVSAAEAPKDWRDLLEVSHTRPGPARQGGKRSGAVIATPGPGAGPAAADLRQSGAATERAALAKQHYPSLNLHIIDRCKHLIQWDAAAEFAALSAGFLAG